MVLIAVPGERIEVEFVADGTGEVEKFFGSTGVLPNEESLQEIERLFKLHGDECGEGAAQQANGADAVRSWYRGFSSGARAAHRWSRRNLQ